MSDKIYIISKIEFSCREMYDFDEVSFEIWDKAKFERDFLTIKEPHFTKDISKYCDIPVYLGDNWQITYIEDDQMKKSIDMLWKYLPRHGHIYIAIEEFNELR